MADRNRALLTAGEAAAVLGIRVPCVWKAAKRGAIPAVRVSPRRLGYPRDAVLLYAENRPRARHKALPIEIRMWGRRDRPVEHTDLMTTTDAAAVLGVTPHTVRCLIRRGRLPCYQPDPCKPGCRISIPSYYVYCLLEKPDYQARRAAFARSAPAGTTWTDDWPEKKVHAVPRRGYTALCDRDYGAFYSTRQAANVMGLSPNGFLDLWRRGRIEGGSRTPELDAYLDALGMRRKPARNRWLFFRKADVHALLNDPQYRQRRAWNRRAHDPEHIAAREAAAAKKFAKQMEACLEAKRKYRTFEPWPELL